MLVRDLQKGVSFMAFSKVDNQRRLNLHQDLCSYANLKRENGKQLMIVSMNDDGTEFDIVEEATTEGVEGLVTIDTKCRVFLPAWLGVAKPGNTFKIIAFKGRIHLKHVQE